MSSFKASHICCFSCVLIYDALYLYVLCHFVQTGNDTRLALTHAIQTASATSSYPPQASDSVSTHLPFFIRLKQTCLTFVLVENNMAISK